MQRIGIRSPDMLKPYGPSNSCKIKLSMSQYGLSMHLYGIWGAKRSVKSHRCSCNSRGLLPSSLPFWTSVVGTKANRALNHCSDSLGSLGNIHISNSSFSFREAKDLSALSRGRCITPSSHANNTVADIEEALATDLSDNAEFERFKSSSDKGNLIPLFERVMADQLTPILAYRCLVKEDERDAPSFLFESVVNGNQQARYSHVGAHPMLEVVATGRHVEVIDRRRSEIKVERMELDDPLQVPIEISKTWKPVKCEGLPSVFTGGWVGYCGYDTVRYVYGQKIPFESAPVDDRKLPDMHLALYNESVLFDNVTKLAYVVSWVNVDEYSSVEEAYLSGKQRVSAICDAIRAERAPQLMNGKVNLSLTQRPMPPSVSNMTREQFLAAIDETKEHIQAGDVFQLVLSQRFERRTYADPFEIYRCLRVVNPSPYMAYLQARGTIVVASSPEILCRVSEDGLVTNRPLAGTRRRGSTVESDLKLEQELLADEKERAEHVMLVDLGRNDVGRVARSGTVKVEKLMEIERYSHVMHISSTVTGTLLPELNCWDALRAALPAGTVSGAPKVRAMQIIDELEASKRGPYGGGVGHVSFTGGMDMALALRTMVIPTEKVSDQEEDSSHNSLDNDSKKTDRRLWKVHLQAGAGVVADSVPEAEYEETVNKAAALGRAIDLAEKAFT